MTGLLQRGSRTINRSGSKKVSDAGYGAFRKRYRTILTRGEKDRPEGVDRQAGCHTLHERLRDHEAAVLRFLKDPDVRFTNTTGERAIRMGTVKITVSGGCRTARFAKASCRISSDLQSMAQSGL